MGKGLSLFVGVILALASSQCMSSSASAETTLDKVKAQKMMTVGTEAAYAPFEFKQDGKIVGLGKDILDEIAKTWSVDIDQIDLPFQGILPGLLAGKFDFVATSVNITADRAKKYAFTLPISENTAYLLIRADNSAIKSEDDLVGKVVAVQLASANETDGGALNDRLKAKGVGEFAELKLYPSFSDTFLAVENGTADAALGGMPTLQALMKEQPDVFKIVSVVSFPKSYNAWVVRGDDTELRDAINAAIIQMKRSGFFSEIQKKWLGTTYDLPESNYLPEGAL